MHTLPDPLGTLVLPVEPRLAAAAPIAERDLVVTVVRQMRKLAGPHPDFDDLVQKALLEAVRSLPSFRGEAQVTTFLYGLCYRVWCRHLRFSTRFFRRFLFVDEGSFPEPVDGLDPSELNQHRQRYQELYRALDKLPPPMRAVVTLHDLDELEIEEIAKIVEANVHTVRSRLRHGRQKLRAILEKADFRRGPS